MTGKSRFVERNLRILHEISIKLRQCRSLFLPNWNLLKSYIDALYSFGDSAVIRLKKRQNWEEVAKLR